MKKMEINYNNKEYIAQPFVEFDVLMVTFYESTPNRFLFKKKYLETKTVWVAEKETVRDAIIRTFIRFMKTIEEERTFYDKIKEYEKNS